LLGSCLCRHLRQPGQPAGEDEGAHQNAFGFQPEVKIPEKGKIIVSLAVIAILVWAAFSPVLRCGFLNWDDPGYVTENRFIRIFSLQNIGKIFTGFFICNYQPATILSYALDYQIFGLSPFGYHLTNLILHLLNSLLVFWLLYKLTHSIYAALLTAVLFGVHPLHTESVAWVSQRKDVLYAFFCLGALVSYAYYLKSGLAKKYFYFALLLYAFSLLSKAMAITFPFILLLTDYLSGRRRGSRVFIDKIPFFALSLIFSAVAVYGQYAGGAVRVYEPINLYGKLLTAVYGTGFYLTKIFFPLRLSCLYPRTGSRLVAPELFIAALACFSVALFIVRDKRRLVWGAGFFTITLLPVLQFVPIGETVVADRYIYLPMLGILYLVSEAAAALFARKLKHGRALSLLSVAALSLISVTLARLTWDRCGVWKDSLTLWSDALRNYRSSALAYLNRAAALTEKGMHKEAIFDLQNALAIAAARPNRQFLYVCLGSAYRDSGQFFKEALSAYGNAIALDPDYAEAYSHLAFLYFQSGDTAKAIELFNKAIKIKPSYALAYDGLGMVYGKLKEEDKAIAVLRSAIREDPGHLAAYSQLAFLYHVQKRQKELRALYESAILNGLKFTDAYINLAADYSDNGEDAKALRLYKQAARIDPNSSLVYAGLGSAYCALGKYGPAIRWLRQALKLDNDFALAHYNLAVAYYYSRRYCLAREHCRKAVALGYPASPKFLKLIAAGQGLW
jgi:tetratricopeptide (TPR) repeat protein